MQKEKEKILMELENKTTYMQEVLKATSNLIFMWQFLDALGGPWSASYQTQGSLMQNFYFSPLSHLSGPIGIFFWKYK